MHPSYLYFAYGSNMNPERMRLRCPKAKLEGVGRLPGWTLDFTHTSRKNGGAVASIVQRDHDEVWGVLYALRQKDVDRLCAHEGYSAQRDDVFNTYIPVYDLPVIMRNGEPLEHAWTFIINPAELPMRPHLNYKNLLVEGAVARRLPQSYIQRLISIEAIV